MLLDFDSKKGEATAAELGENAAFYKVDVSDYASVERAMEATADAFGGRIDIMVNCAGIVGPTKMKIDEVDVNAFDRVCSNRCRFLRHTQTHKYTHGRRYGHRHTHALTRTLFMPHTHPHAHKHQ